jgi:hypothetical protein
VASEDAIDMSDWCICFVKLVLCILHIAPEVSVASKKLTEVHLTWLGVPVFLGRHSWTRSSLRNRGPCLNVLSASFCISHSWYRMTSPCRDHLIKRTLRKLNTRLDLLTPSSGLGSGEIRIQSPRACLPLVTCGLHRITTTITRKKWKVSTIARFSLDCYHMALLCTSF